MILGANGRIGRLLQATWSRQPPPAIMLFWQSRTAAGPAGITWSLQEGTGALAGRIPDGIDVMLVLAGATPPEAADYAHNSTLAKAALEAAALAGVGQVILTSSAAVYGVPAGSEPLNEDAVARPVTPYGQAKRAMEVMAERCPALALTILRIGNVAGADQMFRAMSTATAGAPLVLDRFSDGRTPVRSYIGPLTLANCLATLVGMSAQAPLPRLLNVGAGDGGVEMAGLLAAMARAGRPVPHRFRAAPPGALSALRLDCARLLALCPMPQQAGTAAVLVEEWLALTGGPR